MDRMLTVSKANKRNSKSWKNVTQNWSEFVKSIKEPRIVSVTYDEYLALDTKQKSAIKDGKGFVGGALRGSRRLIEDVLSRDVLTYDYDTIPKDFLPTFLESLNKISCAYVCYSTLSNSVSQPKIRVLIPLNRTVTVEEYEPIARKVAEKLSIEYCDPTCFRINHLMFNPSSRQDDTLKFFMAHDGDFIAADSVLGEYSDWRDIEQWARPSSGKIARTMSGVHTQKPREKINMVGACCRVYDIHSGIDKYLLDVYEPTDEPDTYRFIMGGEIPGFKVIDKGDTGQSWHATDPISGYNVNFFDLLRVHKFGHLDENPFVYYEVTESFKATCKFLENDPDVMAEYNKMKAAGLIGQHQEEGYDASWLTARGIRRNANDKPLKTLNNVLFMLENDPRLKGRIKFNDFIGRKFVTNPLPWGRRANSVANTKDAGNWISDADSAGLRMYVEKMLDVNNKDLISTALMTHADSNRFNPVTEYLSKQIWDGNPRLDTLFVKYFGAVDSPYVRTVTRKAFVAAVARAYEPGCKFQNCTIILGNTAIGKSSLFQRMGMEWFTDGVTTLEGKEGAELIQNFWIVELGELEAYQKSKNVNTAIAYISRDADNYRKSYAEEADVKPRKCVFFGTTNQPDFLKAHAGNRRFWAIPTQKQAHKIDMDDLTPTMVGLLWAEAVVRYQEGEKLYLPEEMEMVAKGVREAHTEHDEYEGLIERYIETQVPLNWDEMPPHERIAFMNSPPVDNPVLMPMCKICTQMVWLEVLGMPNKNIPPRESIRINRAFDKVLASWGEPRIIRTKNIYDRQRGRINSDYWLQKEI